MAQFLAKYFISLTGEVWNEFEIFSALDTLRIFPISTFNVVDFSSEKRRSVLVWCGARLRTLCLFGRLDGKGIGFDLKAES